MNPKYLATKFNINAILDKSAPERKTFLDKMLDDKVNAEKFLEKHGNYLPQKRINELTEMLQVLNTKIAQVRKTLPLNLFITPGFILIKAGRFLMGEDFDLDADNPKHIVILTHNFELGQYQVTQAEYLKYKEDHEFGFAGKPKNPAENINWHDAVGYCKWLSLQAKDIERKYKELIQDLSMEDYVEYAIKYPETKLYRLPTEAEWEYAAREEGKSMTRYPGKDDLSDIDEYAIQNNRNQKNKSTQIVGSMKANKLGLYDMIGNVWEWCVDGYDKSFFNDSKKEYKDPCNLKENFFRVLRGGSWLDSEVGFSSRLRLDPDDRAVGIGFRVARTVISEDRP